VVDAEVASPEADAVQTSVVVALKGPEVAGLEAVVAAAPFAAHEMVAPEVVELTTGETVPVKVSDPGLKVGAAVVAAPVTVKLAVTGALGTNP
jgi:hypothetical protein